MAKQSTEKMILGSLMKEPTLLLNLEKYLLTNDDFNDKLNEYIFYAISNMAYSGAKSIKVQDVELELRGTRGEALFTTHNGVDLLNDYMALANSDNFDSYYKLMKKENLLRDMSAAGFDTSRFYADNPFTDEEFLLNEECLALDNSEIIDIIRLDLLTLENEYGNNEISQTESVAQGIYDLIEDLEVAPRVGLPLQGSIFNGMIGGAKRGTYMVRSASSGSGKALPNTCRVPTPIGWRTVGEIQPGDYLFDAFGKPTQVTSIHPQGLKEVWQVTLSDGRVAECCEEHLWSYAETSTELQDRRFQTNTLAEIRQKINIGHRIFLPQNEAVQHINYSSKISVLNKCFNYDKKDDLKTYKTNNYIDFAEIQELIYALGKSLEFKMYQLDGAYIIEPLREPLEGIEIISIKNKGVYEDMTCFVVSNSEHLFLMNDFIVTHNTRSAVADACQMAYPIRYDQQSCRWVHDGHNEKVMLIITEQQADEVKPMILAYLTGFNQDRIDKISLMSKQEKEIVMQAAKGMEDYQDNFYIVRFPEPTIQGIKNLVRMNVLAHDISYVFYDYIFINPGLLREFKHSKLRNDEVLLMFSTALKDLAVELDIFIATSTQTSSSAENNTDIRNEGSIAGARAIVNKADVGCVMARPTVEELKGIQSATDHLGLEPNIVTDLYKNRNGRYTNVRIWSYFDMGTMQKQDLFVTNSRLDAIDYNSNSIVQFDFKVPAEEYIDILNEVNQIGGVSN